MSDQRRFTIIGWYHLGFLHPAIRRTVMLVLSVVVASLLILYIVPFKYAIGVMALWAVLFAIFLFVRRTNRF